MSFLQYFLIFLCGFTSAALGVSGVLNPLWLILLFGVPCLLFIISRLSAQGPATKKLVSLCLSILFAGWGVFQGIHSPAPAWNEAQPETLQRGVYTNLTVTVKGFALLSPRTNSQGLHLYQLQTREGIRLWSEQLSGFYHAQKITARGELYSSFYSQRIWHSLYVHHTPAPATPLPPLPAVLQSRSAALDADFSPAVYVRTEPPVRLNWISRLRQASADLILRNTSGDVRALLFSILMGNRLWMDWSEQESFRRSGVSHILALSGLHIGIFSVIFLSLFRLGMRPMASYLLVSLLLIIYILFGGMSPSLLRAGLLFISWNLLRAGGFEPDWLDILSATAFIILSLDSGSIYDPGFLLSYAATLGIVLFSPRLEARLSWLPVWLARSISVTFCATLSTLPVTLAFFGGFSLSGLAVNLVIVPVFSLVLILLLVLFVLISAGLPAGGLQWLVQKIWDAMSWLTDISSRPSWTYLEAGTPSGLISIILLILLLTVFFILPLLQTLHIRRNAADKCLHINHTDLSE